jgi:glycosyltransferase involved in cell wall biosynthesis
MSPKIAIAVTNGPMSGGGRVLLANMKELELERPEMFSDISDPRAIPLILRNVASITPRRYLILPQNAWPWTRDRTYNFYESRRKVMLLAASEISMRLAAGEVRVGEAIPPRCRSVSAVVPSVLDGGFERSLDRALSTNAIAGSGAIACVGAMDCYRNVERLIDAYAAYRATGGSLRLVLGGAGLHVPEAPPPGVSLFNRVLERSEVLRLVLTAPAVIFPSLVEASPIGALEGLELGGRVALSDIAGHRDVMHRSRPRDVLFFDPRSVAAITTALHGLESMSHTSPATGLADIARRVALRELWRDEMGHILTELAQ